MTGEAEAFCFGDFVLQASGPALHRQGQLIALAMPVLRVLLALVRARGETVDADALIEAGWSGARVGEGSLRQAVWQLRRVLDGDGEPSIVTLRGSGYRFTPALAEPLAATLDATLDATLGRARELALLHEAWQQARRGQGQAILLSGPSGIGKTHLLRAALAQAARDGARVLAMDEDTTFPELTQPLVLGFDDLDAVPERMRRRLLQLAGQAPVLLIATARQLASHSLRELPLAGLDEEALARLVDHADLHRLTGGNPGFALEAAQARQLDAQRAHHGLRAAVRRRFDQLPLDAQRALRSAAVLGERFDRCDLRALYDGEGLAQAAGWITPHGLGHQFAHPLLREVAYDSLDAPRALHALALAQLERRHASTLALHLPALAHHAFMGAVPRAATYVEAAARQALAQSPAQAAQLFERARQLCTAGESPDSRRGLTLELERLEALHAAGERASEVRAGFAALAEQTRTLDEPVLLARAALGFAGHGFDRLVLMRVPLTVDAAECALLRCALAQLPIEEVRLRVLLWSALGLALVHSVTHEACRDALQKAEELATGDRDLHARVLHVRILAESGPDALDARLARCASLLELAEPGTPLHVEALTLRGMAQIARGCADHAALDFRRAAQLAHELDDPRARERSDVFVLFRAFWEGRLDDVEQLAAAQFSAASDPLRARLVVLTRMIGVQYLRHGETLARGPGAALLEGAFPQASSARCARAAELALRGEHAAALESFDALALDDFAALPRGPTWLSDMVTLATIPCTCSEAARARLLYERLLPHAEQYLVYALDALPGAPIAATLGLLADAMGERARALRWLEHAAAQCKRQRMPLLQHVIESDYARILAQGGSELELRRARALAAVLRAFAREHGIGLLSARADRIAAVSQAMRGALAVQ
ncbi:MAG: AAA family ATPase [Polyangiales bacterium]